MVPLQLSGELGTHVSQLVLLGFQTRTCCIRGLCSRLPCATCPTPIDCGCRVWLLLFRTERKFSLFIQSKRHLVSAVVLRSYPLVVGANTQWYRLANCELINIIIALFPLFDLISSFCFLESSTLSHSLQRGDRSLFFSYS